MKKKLFCALFLLLLSATLAQAEVRHSELTVFGMD
ncbi:MAG: hypothetical protein JWO20_3048 [Candidatus Angelobacter sp.]|jgi:hypothetical protein|nr:hypothetical protein [Candidatus Angelobacter sp.]